MKTVDAIEYYGSVAKLADQLGITKQAVSKWGEYVPELRALQLERMTNGKLKYSDPEASAA